MDTLNTYSRRAALLQQRKNAANPTASAGPSAGQGTITYHSSSTQPSHTTVHSLVNKGGGVYPQTSSTVPASSNGTTTTVSPPKVITNFSTSGAEHGE